jgi:LytS/YehU family sensor histidine kinase
MKQYVVMLIHCLIWSGYTFVDWLAEKDRLEAKIMLLFIFSYFAYLTAQSFGISKKKSLVATICSMGLFFMMKQTFYILIQT